MFVLALHGREKKVSTLQTTRTEIESSISLEKKMMLTDLLVFWSDDFPALSVIEVDEEATLAICEANNYTYAIIEENDLIIPPRVTDD